MNETSQIQWWICLLLFFLRKSSLITLWEAKEHHTAIVTGLFSFIGFKRTICIKCQALSVPDVGHWSVYEPTQSLPERIPTLVCGVGDTSSHLWAGKNSPEAGKVFEAETCWVSDRRDKWKMVDWREGRLFQEGERTCVKPPTPRGSKDHFLGSL